MPLQVFVEWLIYSWCTPGEESTARTAVVSLFAAFISYGATAVGRWSLVKKNNTGGGRGCFGRRPTWDRKQRWMGDECDENPTVNSAPRGLKYSAGHNHDEDLDSVVLVGVVAWPKLLLTMIYRPRTLTSPQRPWRYHDNQSPSISYPYLQQPPLCLCLFFFKIEHTTRRSEGIEMCAEKASLPGRYAVDSPSQCAPSADLLRCADVHR